LYCTKTCEKFTSEIDTHEGGRYEQGQKRCSQCEIFITWKGLDCPCCGRLLRTKSRDRKLKHQLSFRLARKECR